MSKLIFVAMMVMGMNSYAGMTIPPTQPAVNCVGTQAYPDHGLNVKVEYAPTQQAYILNIDRVTFAGTQTIREAAHRLQERQPNKPVVFASQNYSLTVNTFVSPQGAYLAVLKHGPTSQTATLNCR